MLLYCNRHGSAGQHWSGNTLQDLISISKNFPIGKDDSDCWLNIEIPLSPNLQMIDSHMFFKFATPHPNKALNICFNPRNSLKVIDLSSNNLVDYVDDVSSVNMSGLIHLTTLNLRNNQLPLHKMNIFSGFPTLQSLLLGGNSIQIHLDQNNDLFHYQADLRYLDLSQNGISHIQAMEFLHLSKLRVLDLSGNELEKVAFELPTSAEFSLLNLAGNRLFELNTRNILAIERYANLTIDLTGNPLSCSCSTLNFVKWISTTSRITNPKKLLCSTEHGPKHIEALDCEKLEKQCHPPILMWSIIGGCVIMGLLVIVSACIVLYMKRWRIRTYFYRRNLRNRTPRLRHYEYDAFLAYTIHNPSVLRWVHFSLREEIEEKRGLKLFIHMRDMLAGGNIKNKIDEAMGKCCKTIVILTPEFLTSSCCDYEAEKVNRLLDEEGQDVAVLIKLERLPFQIPTTVSKLCENRQCLQWTEEASGQKLFWDQLEDALWSPNNTLYQA